MTVTETSPLEPDAEPEDKTYAPGIGLINDAGILKLTSIVQPRADGPKEKYWPGDFELEEKPPAGAWWRAARSVPRRDGTGQFIRVAITPPRPVGAHTRLRFRYHLTGASALTVQIFDLTVQANRHIRLTNLKQGKWTTHYLDFSRDSRRNDGTPNSPFTAGNLVDDLFFFVENQRVPEAILFVDEVVLFDAGRSGSK